MTTTILVKDIPPFVEKIHVSGGGISFEYEKWVYSLANEVKLFNSGEEAKNKTSDDTLNYRIVKPFVPFKIVSISEKYIAHVEVLTGEKGWIFLDVEYFRVLK